LEGEWGRLTATQRGRLLHRLAELITRDAERLAELETRDNGKLLREMSGQMAYLPEWYRYFGGLADKLEGSVIPTDKPNYLVYTRHEPVGVVAAITPWNSPLLLLTWKLAPALAAGCTVVVKPSDFTPVSTLALADLVVEAGFPPGVVNVVTGWGPQIGQALTTHPGVDKIAFTGSTQVGKLIARAAADNLTRVTLELGGKSAQVVFSDADLDAAANGIIAGVFAATGQTCMAGSRVVVHQDVEQALVEKGRRTGALDHDRRPARPGDRDGAGGDRQAVRHRPEPLRQRPRGRRHHRLRRGAGPAARWLVRRADGAHRHHLRHARGPGGDLRPGRGGHDLPGRGRGGPAGQRHGVRPGRLGMDQGRAPGAPRGCVPAPSGSTPTGS